MSTCRLIWLMAALFPGGAILPTTAHAADFPPWSKVADAIYRSAGFPCAYAIVEADGALLIGAPRGVSPANLPPGARRYELVLLTHHHRDTSWSAGTFVEARIPVRAPQSSASYLLPDGVRKFWETSMPVETLGRFPPLFERYWNDWSYLVHPVGIAGLQCDLDDRASIEWRGWSIQTVSTPGHSRDHVAFLARRKVAASPAVNPVICFCGDAYYQPGKLWSPYTAEWHHQKDEGLAAAGLSLRRLASLQPDLLCPEHGPPLAAGITAALTETAQALEQTARLKNYVDFTAALPGKRPEYAFLAPEQVGTAAPAGNPKPWTQLSPHLFLTGNIYALASKDGPVLLMDPYSQDVIGHLAQLKQQYGFGPLEAALVSHAHNDHYTGLFALPDRTRYQVWTLDRIAAVIGDPRRYRAPYVDPRPVKVDRLLKDGETVTWREYELKIHHQPGQTVFAMAVEVNVDGRKCLFTGDNFYHADQYSGNGGWSGRNRGLPGGSATSAQKVLELKPDWILAEHGGAFEFNAEDFRRRVQWAEAAALAADSVSPSGRHTFDWDPHRVRIEPLISTVHAGNRVQLKLVAANPGSSEETLRFEIPGRGLFDDVSGGIRVEAGQERQLMLDFRIAAAANPGRYVFPAIVTNTDGEIAADVFCVITVPPRP